MLETLLGTRNKIDQFLESSKENSSIILYGAGFALTDIVKKLEAYGFSVVAICDSDPEKQGKKYRDAYPIMSLAEAKQHFPNARFLISSTSYFDEIYSILDKAIGKERLCDVDLTCAYFFEKAEFTTFFTEQTSRFQAIYDRLEDRESKQTYFNVIKAHMTGERKDFEAASTGTDDLYLFQSLLKPTANTVYVDCGAYDGDTVQLFLKAADAGYSKVFAFEPDPAMQASLQSIADSQNGKVEIIPKGVSDSDGTVSFLAKGLFSNIVEESDEETITISVARLDTLLIDKAVSILKMDIEGSEYDALRGAEQIIKTHKPKLAICLYHKVEDLVRIAELILQMVPEYKLRLKHQSTSCMDTILFATLD